MFREELAASVDTVHCLPKSLFDFPNSGLTEEFGMVEVVWAVVAVGGAEAAAIDVQAFEGAAEGFQMVESLGVVEPWRIVGQLGVDAVFAVVETFVVVQVLGIVEKFGVVGMFCGLERSDVLECFENLPFCSYYLCHIPASLFFHFGLFYR